MADQTQTTNETTQKKPENDLQKWGVLIPIERAVQLCDGVVAIRQLPSHAQPGWKDKYKGKKLRQENRVLYDGPGSFKPPYGTKWEKKEAEGSKPEHFHAKPYSYDIHLRDGFKPGKEGEVLRGRIEVKVREITLADGNGFVNWYMYLNIFPLKDIPEDKTVMVSISDKLPNVKDAKDLRIFSPLERIINKERIRFQTGYLFLRKPGTQPTPRMSIKPDEEW